MKNIRNVTGGEVDDGVFSLGMGVEVANPFSEKGRNIIKDTWVIHGIASLEIIKRKTKVTLK